MVILHQNKPIWLILKNPIIENSKILNLTIALLFIKTEMREVYNPF